MVDNESPHSRHEVLHTMSAWWYYERGEDLYVFPSAGSSNPFPPHVDQLYWCDIFFRFRNAAKIQNPFRILVGELIALGSANKRLLGRLGSLVEAVYRQSHVTSEFSSKSALAIPKKTSICSAELIFCRPGNPRRVCEVLIQWCGCITRIPHVRSEHHGDKFYKIVPTSAHFIGWGAVTLLFALIKSMILAWRFVESVYHFLSTA